MSLEIQERRKQIVKNYIEAYNSFDVKGMLRDLHKDVTFENIANGAINLQLKGIEAFEKQAEQAKALFSSRKQRIQAIHFDADKVEVAISYKGTLAVDLPNGMKAGDVIEMVGQSIFTFQDNLVIGIKDLI